MSGAALVSMPFGIFVRPSIGLSLLKAALERDGLSCDLYYLNLRFAARLSARLHDFMPGAERLVDELYQFIALSPPWFQVGEWLFAADLFGDAIPPPHRYFAEAIQHRAATPSGAAPRPLYSDVRESMMLAVREQVEGFLDECLAAVPWEACSLVGFTTTFQQSVPSLALARRLKARYPQLTIVFGGANCEAEMGIALHRLFPFVDYVCLGEGDLAFPRLARRVLAGEPVEEIAGIVRRVDGATVVPRARNAPVPDLDSLPIPRYDDFLEQWAAVALPDTESPSLLLETARGCWWGQKSHCTFCGLNGETMQFRTKSPARAVAEITQLVERYQPRVISAVDNIIDMRYFRDVLPRLKELDLDVALFYETKANLRKEQVRLLREAGITRIQPGIESLSTNVLRLMGKGVTALQNIQLLRWCAEFGVDVFWNLLAGFPGEDPADYARQAAIVPLLTHLPPPSGIGPIRLDRFSPLYEQAGQRGIVNVRAARAYGYIFPFAPADLAELAYYFDFDYADGRDPGSYIGELAEQVHGWINGQGSRLASLAKGDALEITDTRPVAVQRTYRLAGRRRALYEYCDQAHTSAEIRAHLAERAGGAGDEAGLDGLLAELEAAKLLLHEDGRYLSLAVAGDYSNPRVGH